MAGNFYFEAETGSRINRFFYGVHDAKRDGQKLTWVESRRSWMNEGEMNTAREQGCKLGWVSNSARCKTLRAFKSHIRRHLLDEARLANRFIGHDIYFEAKRAK